MSNIIKPIEGFQSLDECRSSILGIATHLNKDISSTWINEARILSLRSLIDLFEQYNNQLKEIN